MTLPITAGYKARLALPTTRRSYIIQFTKKDASVVGFTDHDQPISYNGVTYNPAYNRSDTVSASDIGNDTFQYMGALLTPQITEESLRIGTWDEAEYILNEIIWDDHALGIRYIRSGTLGEVSLNRFDYTAQLDGMAKKYATVFGNLTQPGCRRTLYDAGCTVVAATYTHTGTITGAGADGFTLYDTGRTEPGPAGGVAIIGITKANPGVVTLASIPSTVLRDGQLVTISGVLGMTQINTQVVVGNVSGATFEVLDTSSYGAYASGGTMTPVGADSSLFDGGVITFTSGANSGSSMEIVDYVPGQLTMALPMPYAVAVGVTYSLTEGCNKDFFTGCIGHFNNYINFDGEPYSPGKDRLTRIGKQH